MHIVVNGLEPLEARKLLAAAEQVVSLSLIDAASDRVIGSLANGGVIDASAVDATRLNVRANTKPAAVGSVRFVLDGKALPIESSGPYALFGNHKNDYFAGTFSVGAHMLVVTPYAAANARGSAGVPLTVRFTVKPKTAATGPAVTGLTLVNTQTDKDIGALVNGTVIDAAAVDVTNLNVRASTKPATVGSVRFVLDGKALRIENGGPYALFGNDKNNFFAGTLAVGTHTLAVTSYSRANATGVAGTPLKVTFTVKSQPAVPVAPAITKFVLVDAVTGRDLVEIHHNDTIDLNDYFDNEFRRGRLTVRVEANGTTESVNIQQVRVRASSDVEYQTTDSTGLYTLYGDAGATYLPGTKAASLKVYQQYKLTATPFAADDAAGVAGAASVLNFTLTDSDPRTLSGEFKFFDKAHKPVYVSPHGEIGTTNDYTTTGTGDLSLINGGDGTPLYPITIQYNLPLGIDFYDNFNLSVGFQASAKSAVPGVFGLSKVSDDKDNIAYEYQTYLRGDFPDGGLIQLSPVVLSNEGTDRNKDLGVFGGVTATVVNHRVAPDVSLVFTADRDGDGVEEPLDVNPDGTFDFQFDTSLSNKFKINNVFEDGLTLDQPIDTSIFFLSLPSADETRNVNANTKTMINHARGFALKSVVTGSHEQVDGNGVLRTFYDIANTLINLADGKPLTLAPGESVELEFNQGNTPRSGSGSGSPSKRVKAIKFRPSSR